MRASEKFRQMVVATREAAGLSLREVTRRAREAGHTIDAAGLALLERGERRITLDDMEALCQVLPISPLAVVADVESYTVTIRLEGP